MTSVPHLPLFVFGTLRRAECNHVLLAGSYSRMIPASLPGYGRSQPLMITPRAGSVVQGELYFVRPDVWDRTIRGCDQLEGIAPGRERGLEYARERVTVTTSEGAFEAWAYVSSRAARQSADSASGD